MVFRRSHVRSSIGYLPNIDLSAFQTVIFCIFRFSLNRDGLCSLQPIVQGIKQKSNFQAQLLEERSQIGSSFDWKSRSARKCSSSDSETVAGSQLINMNWVVLRNNIINQRLISYWCWIVSFHFPLSSSWKLLWTASHKRTNTWKNKKGRTQFNQFSYRTAPEIHSIRQITNIRCFNTAENVEMMPSHNIQTGSRSTWFFAFNEKSCSDQFWNK
jgi:hypothetical protein